jgi:hypothetical protein
MIFTTEDTENTEERQKQSRSLNGGDQKQPGLAFIFLVFFSASSAVNKNV